MNSNEVNNVNETNLRLFEVSDMTHDQNKNKYIVYTYRQSVKREL